MFRSRVFVPTVRIPPHIHRGDLSPEGEVNRGTPAGVQAVVAVLHRGQGQVFDCSSQLSQASWKEVVSATHPHLNDKCQEHNTGGCIDGCASQCTTNWVLFNLLHSFKKRWRSSAYFQPQVSQPIPKSTPIPNDSHKDSNAVHKCRRVVYINQL